MVRTSIDSGTRTCYASVSSRTTRLADGAPEAAPGATPTVAQCPGGAPDARQHLGAAVHASGPDGPEERRR